MLKLTKIISLAAVFLAPSLATAAEVNVVSWGGAYTESQKLGYGDPYAEKSGVAVNWIDYSGGLGEIKAQVESGAITWDIIDVYARDTIIGCDEGLFVEFDFDNDFPAGVNGMPASEDFFAPMPSKCAVGNILYSWNFAYNTDVFQWNAPSTMGDFFDADKYKGVRSLYSSAMSNLEFALVADGVPAADVYDYMEENGIDRALDKITELCEHPDGGCIFWSAGAQPPEQLVSGEAEIAI